MRTRGRQTEPADGRPAIAPSAEPRPERAVAWWAPLAVALAAVFAAQARTMTFFFFQDDFVPFGEMVKHGAARYTWNLITVQDLTPNWRVVPGLLYLANYELFGVEPLPVHVTTMALHLGTVALLYALVVRTTQARWAAVAAGLLFGIHPAYAGTLGQLGLAHVAATFLIAATLLAVVESARAPSTRIAMRWLGAAVALYVLVLASNESMAAVWPLFGLALLLFDDGPAERPGQRVARAAVRSLPFAALAFSAAAAFTACDCTAAEETYEIGSAHRAFLIYMGRLLWPLGLEGSPSYIDAPHLVAGLALTAIAAVSFARGNALARLGVTWMVLALVPHVLIATHTAPRFTYIAAAGFALLVSGIAVAAVPWLRRAHVAAPAVAGIVALAAVAPWYAVETHRQNEPWREDTEDWRLLHDELLRVFPEVPPGAWVQVIGGPLTHPINNFYVMPAMAWTMWNPGVTLHTYAPGDPFAAQVRQSENPYAAEFRDGRLVPLRPSP